MRGVCMAHTPFMMCEGQAVIHVGAHSHASVCSSHACWHTQSCKCMRQSCACWHTQSCKGVCGGHALVCAHSHARVCAAGMRLPEPLRSPPLNSHAKAQEGPTLAPERRALTPRPLAWLRLEHACSPAPGPLCWFPPRTECWFPPRTECPPDASKAASTESAPAVLFPTHAQRNPCAAYRCRLLPAMPIQPRLPWLTAPRHARPATPTVADCFPPCPSNTPKAAKLVAAPGSSSQVLCAASSHLSSPCVRVRVYVHLYVCTHMRVCVCVLRCVRAHVDTFVVQAASRAHT